MRKMGARSLADLVRMRLSEHILHTWDIEVIRNPQATLAGDAAGLVLDFVTQMGGMVGKPQGQELRVHVTTEHPERHFQLAVGTDGVSVDPAGPERTPTAEATQMRFKYVSKAL